MENLSQSYEASPAIWNHKVSLTCHPTQLKYGPHINPSQTGRYSICLSQRDGRLSWPYCWLY